MDDQHESEYNRLPNQFRWDTISLSSGETSTWSLSGTSSRHQSPRLSFGLHQFSKTSSHPLTNPVRHAEQLRLNKLCRRLAERNAEPVTSISSFMAAVAVIDPPFKPRTLYRPWSISAGHGAHGAVEVHRYVPGRNFNVFNDQSSLKLVAYEPDAKRTGDYYAVKRLASLNPDLDGNTTTTKTKSNASNKRNSYALLADELRILAHPDLRGHPNIVYLFGVSHTPSRGGLDSAEANLVLQEGDCGDLYSFYRDVDMRFNRHTLIEVKLSLCFDIASGIEALHRHGVVHCDIKPQNILIRRRSGRDQKVLRCQSEMEAGQVALQSLMGQSPFVAMLADFGGSIIMADHVGDNMRLKVSTPLWCAPECYSKDPLPKALLPRVDIYSAGLVFAFIFLEGRDIFSQVVDRGLVHQYDTTWDRETVRSSKESNAILALARKQVREFETTVFGITATGKRVYVSRETMYPSVVASIFDDILGLALHADPGKRVANATALLEPWHKVLQGNFHVENSLHYSQPGAFRSFTAGVFGGKDYFSKGKTCAKPDGHTCSSVPALTRNSATGMSLGVFEIRSSFTTFRASLTSNLKSAIIKDMVQEVELLQSIQRHPHATESLYKSHQRRAADCAYQVAIACLEGFGRPRDDKESLKWMKIAAEWGSPIAQAEILPLTLSLGVQCKDKDGGSADPTVQWAIDAVADQGHSGAVNALWQVNEKKCTESVLKYRAKRTKKIEAAFELRTGEKWEEVCWHEDWRAKLRKLNVKMSRGFTAVSRGFTAAVMAAQYGNWTLLHYAAALSPEGRLLEIPALERVKFLVEKLDIDVRQVNADNATPLDLAMVRGNMRIVNYLLNWHERWKPRPFPGSCPLQNIGYLPDWSIADIVDRIRTMAPQTSIDERLSSTKRTPLLNAILTKEPLLPPAREASIVALLAHGANPLLTTLDSSPVSALLTAVTQVQPPLVGAMLQAIKTFGHGTVQPNLANELARAFLRLMQTPRSVSLTTGLNTSMSVVTRLIGVTTYELSLGVIIKLMLEQGVSAELRTVCRGMQHDALGLASYYGRDEAMQAILKSSEGPGPLTRHRVLGLSQVGSIDGLATAIECGFVEAVDLLLPHMAKRPELDDHTLILTGAVHHQPALVQQVFGHFERAGRGAEVLEFQDQWGATVLDLALEYGYFDLARFLLAKGAKYDVYRVKGDHSIDDGRQSTLASVLPRMQPIKFLMELTPKPRLIVTSSGFNVFHVLAADEKLIGTTIGRAEFLQVLEYFYALDPTLIHARGGAEGFTPFHVVSLHYSEIVGSFLHTHGADVNAPSTKGHTPLDLLYFHDDGDRGVEEHLTVDYRSANGVPRTGVAICDFAMAGPVYWKLEAKLAARLKELYKTWGAKRGLMTMMRKLGLQNDPMTAFWSGGITAYYEGEDGKEHARHFPG